MIAMFHPGEWTALLVAVGAVLTGLWRVMTLISKLAHEHALLMADLKARTEHVEHATPGITPLPESEKVREVIEGNGADIARGVPAPPGRRG